MAEATGFICDICGKSFKDARGLGAHKRFIHNIDKAGEIVPKNESMETMPPATGEKRKPGRPKKIGGATKQPIASAGRKVRRRRRRANSTAIAAAIRPVEKIAVMTINFCYNCGTKLVPGSIYCHNCGTKTPRP